MAASRAAMTNGVSWLWEIGGVVKEVEEWERD